MDDDELTAPYSISDIALTELRISLLPSVQSQHLDNNQYVNDALDKSLLLSSDSCKSPVGCSFDESESGIADLDSSKLHSRINTASKLQLLTLSDHHEEHYSERELEKLSEFESLDYQISRNDLYMSQLSTLTKEELNEDNNQRWLLAFYVGVLTGVVAFVVHYVVDFAQDAKFEFIFGISQKNGRTVAWIVLLLLNIGITLPGTLIIMYFAPAASGSGLPFVKSYLNGVRIPKAFNLKTLIAKVIGVISCVSSSLPVGPEGPMIHIGGMIGGGVSQSRSKTLGCELPYLRRFKNDHDRRDFITMGAACGVAAAFGAPSGGLLFSMEEASSFWSSSITWRTFFACIVATFISNGITMGILKNASLSSLIIFVIKDLSAYQLFEILPFTLLGIIGGLFGAAFVRLNLHVTKLREKYFLDFQEGKILEILIILLIWTSSAFVIPYFSSCSKIQIDVSTSDIPTSFYGLGQWDCPAGSFNPLASFLFDSQASLFKMMLSTNPAIVFDFISLALLAVWYFIASAVIAGSTMSSGLMVPLLIIGAAYGRILGKIVKIFFPTAITSSYALIGATSFFGGVSRMTISLTIIMIEITNSLDFILPIMIAAMISKWCGDYFTHPLYDALIEAQRIPFLESDPSPIFDILRVRDVMKAPVCCLNLHATIKEICEALCNFNHNGFPVVESDQNAVFRGFILRNQLLVLLQEKAWLQNFAISHEDFQIKSMNLHNASSGIHLTDEIAQDAVLNLEPFMNRSQLVVYADFSCSVAFRLFRSMGLRHLVVVNAMNKVVGIITRKDLLEPVVLLRNTAKRV